MPVPHGRPAFSPLHTRDFTPEELAALAGMDIYRAVWHPIAGRGIAVGWFGAPPAIVPAIHFLADPEGTVAAIHPAGLVYLS